MHNFSRLLFVVVLGLVGGFSMDAAEPKADDSLVGTWKLVSVRNGGYPDLFTYANRQTLKHVTATHCTTVSYHKDGTVFSLTGGVYAREKGRYTERIDHGIEPSFTVVAAAKSFTGKREHTYEYTFSDDVLYLTIQHKDGIKRDEVWQRVSPIAPGESKPVAKP